MTAVWYMRGLSIAALAAGGMSASGAAAQSVACGTDYTVRAGDFLSSIAQRAYGVREGWRFSLIYNANADVIGPNPGLIDVGAVLFVPCLGGDSEGSGADAAAIRRVETVEALPAPEPDRPIRVVTGTDWAPFLDEDQEQGGMITEIVNLALAEAEGSPDYRIDFINDWTAHLSPLLTDHAYDFSIAWTRPNCDLIDELDEDGQFRCNNFDWSEPLYQQVVAYYSLSELEEYTDHAQLVGLRICRPDGYSIAMLEEVGLSDPDVTLVRPVDPAGCLAALGSGEADVAVLATDVVEGLLAAADGDAPDVRMHEPLAYVSALRAAIAKTNPRREAFLDALNDGLAKIKDSGVWFSTVRRHLTEHREAGS